MDVIRDIVIWDILDILIVSYVIYHIILLIRGTRAVQLLKGVFIVIAIWLISIWFNLTTLQLLVNQMFTFGLLAVIIIFQPELRRALEQLGRGRFFTRANPEEEKEISERIVAVIAAVETMSKRMIGALIVFERETGLTDYVESGIAVESKISPELLINIFEPNTPLHDGAVILRQNAIAAAGCYLPLSENPFISKELGTRHRAAIGLTEVSDAISLTVSEETGVISLSINGQLVRDLKGDALSAKLHELLRPERRVKEGTPFWKRWRDRRG